MAKFYAKSHEWVELDGDVATIGISNYAQNALGDITYVETPAPGTEFKAGDVLGVVESVKAVSDVYAPVSGTASEGNALLEEDPGAANRDPEGEGWICKFSGVSADELTSLMDEAAYQAYVQTL